jgi:hypothetical protein
MRLIDADALPSRALEEKRFVFTMYDRINNEYIVETVYKDLADFINEAPTIDAVPVVRCKDCENLLMLEGRDERRIPLCSVQLGFVPLSHNIETWFCPLGERRVDNDRS